MHRRLIIPLRADGSLVLPLHADVRHGIRVWPSEGNFVYGDCVVAAFEHLRMVKGTSNASSWKKLLYQIGFRPPHTPYSIEIYAKYLATLNQKPSPTIGVDPNTFFPWAEENKLITAWGTVNVDKTFVDANGLTMRDRLHQAMIDYRGVMTSIELTTDAYQNFENGKPWDVGPSPADQPNPNLGHETALVAYGPELDSVVTWGQMKSQTAAFTEDTTYQAFVFLDAQDISRPNYAQLLANIKNL